MLRRQVFQRHEAMVSLPTDYLDRLREVRMGLQNAVEIVFFQYEEVALRLGSNSGRARLGQKQCNLAEAITLAQRGLDLAGAALQSKAKVEPRTPIRSKTETASASIEIKG